MAFASRSYTAPYDKLMFLCQETGLRGGRLHSPDEVLCLTSLKKSQFYSLFGSKNRAGEIPISTEHVSAVTVAFNQDGYLIEVEWWDAALEPFKDKCRAANPQALLPKALPAPSLPRDEPTEPPSTAWVISPAVYYTELAEASLHRPRPFSNSQPEFGRLDGTFRCEIVEYPYDGRSIAVGLREVVLAFDPVGCVFAANSLLGDTRRPMEGVKVGANSITVKAKPGAMLEGSPLQGESIADLEPVGDGLPSVGLAVSAPERGFGFAFLDADGNRAGMQRLEDANKEIILNMIYNSAINDRQDGRGRMRLADSKVEMKRECDPSKT